MNLFLSHFVLMFVIAFLVTVGLGKVVGMSDVWPLALGVAFGNATIYYLTVIFKTN